MTFTQLSLLRALFGGSRRSAHINANTKRTRTSPTESAQALRTIWLRLRREFFPDRHDLDTYKITWSRRRQKRVLGSCNTKKRSVIVAREMAHPEAVRWLDALVYHELCHAVLGDDVGYRGRRKAWHGRTFKALEQRHPQSAALSAWIKAGGWRQVVRSRRRFTTPI